MTEEYGKMNPLAIYDRSQRLDVNMFNGLIHKILENRTQIKKVKRRVCKIRFDSMVYWKRHFNMVFTL